MVKKNQAQQKRGGRGGVQTVASTDTPAGPRRTNPDAIAVEDIFYAKHANAAIKLGHVRGVVLLLVAKRQLPLAEYAPALVKRTVAGRGAADKEQVARVVGAMLGLSELPGEDATDALAIAITHLTASRVRRR